MAEIHRFLIPPGQRVLEIGSGEGDLLAAVSPAVGIGVDISAGMLRRAARRHPDLCFVQADAQALCLRQAFDVIILSDLLNDVWDVEQVLSEVMRLCHPRTRVIINGYSRVWEPILRTADRLGLARPSLYQNWLAKDDLLNLVYLADFEPIRHWGEILWPLPWPGLEPLMNRVLVRLWPFSQLSLTHFVVPRPAPRRRVPATPPVVSVIVPCRNEAGNIVSVVERTPELGAGTELILVEGHSRDETYLAAQRSIARHPERSCRLLRQTGVGKGDAVRAGFAEARGELLVILDADLSVPPEDLARFYDVLVSGKAELANGVRLVYPMEDEAMPFLNMLGNKMFSLVFTWLLGQPIKDTLCGTKALWRSDYDRIAAQRRYFGDFDPFGDFDLLFGAARQNLKILDVPIRYHRRRYGKTNIERWRHGSLLLRMVAFAAARLKFV